MIIINFYIRYKIWIIIIIRYEFVLFSKNLNNLELEVRWLVCIGTN